MTINLQMMLVGLFIFSCFICYQQSHANHTHNISEPYAVKSFKPNQPCEPFEPITLNYSSPSLRISERKCLEYLERAENNIGREKWKDKCYERVGIRPTIFRGSQAKSNEFPHMGAVGWRAKDSSVKWVFKCGSSLISEKFLLTAAHCSKLSLKIVSDIIQKEPQIVRLGNINILYNESLAFQKFHDWEIDIFILHPKYVSPAKYYDIALIKLRKAVPFINSLYPACIWPNDNFNEIGNEALITGWGYTEHGHLSEILQVATIHVLETSLCEELLKQFQNRNWHGFQNHQICAGELAGGPDTCQGDSGGPIQMKMPLKWIDRNSYWVLGVTSFGIKCGEMNRPGIYTRVSSFIDWIEEVVWKPME